MERNGGALTLTSEERKAKESQILLHRDVVKKAGVCDLCGDEEEVGIHENVLLFDFKDKGGVVSQLVVCNFHEGVMLMKLLRSYLKRRKCGPKRIKQKMGFVGAIPILNRKVAGGDEEVLSIIEKLVEKKPVVELSGKDWVMLSEEEAGALS